MKRKLLTIILMVTLSITSLTACGHKENNKENKENKEKIILNTFIVEESLRVSCFSDQEVYIVYDKNTKVKYLFCIGEYNSDITQLYNADGTLQIHED